MQTWLDPILVCIRRFSAVAPLRGGVSNRGPNSAISAFSALNES